MRGFLVCSVLVFSLILNCMSVSPAFSYSEGFEESSAIITIPPIVCGVEIESPQYDSKMVMKITQNAIMEWKGHLQQTERYTKDQYIWDIKYSQISLDQKDSYDFSKCDVIIRFQDKPDDTKKEECKDIPGTLDRFCLTVDPDTCDLLGATFQEISPIEIYIYYRNFCYGDRQLTENQINTIVLHEFGHALGLGHYLSDDENINSRWAHAETMAPSIMVKFATDNTKHEQIRPSDVDKVLSLYGNDGFLSDSVINKTESKSSIDEINTEGFSENIDDDLGYSIKYPPGWDMGDSNLAPDTNHRVYDVIHDVLTVFDNLEGWVSRFQVKYIIFLK